MITAMAACKCREWGSARANNTKQEHKPATQQAPARSKADQAPQPTTHGQQAKAQAAHSKAAKPRPGPPHTKTTRPNTRNPSRLAEPLTNRRTGSAKPRKDNQGAACPLRLDSPTCS
jgi:hypothetical protein